MNKLILTILTVMASATVTVSAARPAQHKAPAAEDMNLATVSHTNPYEIVPAAGMELLFGDEQSAEAAAITGDMLGFAKKFMGTRYRSGGKTPGGFDCSGFTSYVYNNFGYKLSPSSSGQYTQGRKVVKSEVQPGDLLFFTGRASRSGRVGHVGIAVTSDPVSGEVTFIHAARTGIRIDRLHDHYYAKRYLGARRVLPD